MSSLEKRYEKDVNITWRSRATLFQYASGKKCLLVYSCFLTIETHFFVNLSYRILKENILIYDKEIWSDNPDQVQSILYTGPENKLVWSRTG